MQIFQLFRRPSPIEQARRELIDCERAQLVAQMAEEYARSMAAYRAAQARLLRLFINRAVL